MHWLWRRLAWIGMIVLGALAAPGAVRSQTVVEIYQRQFYRQQALRLIHENGERARPRPPDRLGTSADSLLQRKPDSLLADAPAPAPAIEIRHVQRIPRLAGAYFESRFGDEDWVFLGANRISVLDTMMTREIRARLEGRFGKPTRTLVDEDPMGKAAAGEIFQFEYWLVVNHDIPLVITDVNGPFERGVAVSTTEPHGDRLLALRDALFADLLNSSEREPFVDYYFDDEIGQWYLTGYDGERFFLDPVDRPGLNRPVLADPAN